MRLCDICGNQFEKEEISCPYCKSIMGGFLSKSITGYTDMRKVDDGVRVRARFESREYALVALGDRVQYSGDGFDVSFALSDPAGTIEGRCDDGIEVDLTYAVIMDMMQRAALDPAHVNWINVGQ